MTLVSSLFDNAVFLSHEGHFLLVRFPLLWGQMTLSLSM